ncbi:aldehyde dehydrogenase [Nocardia neocaledoniensis NBRC 108232]|uniref:Aldehyde dehydrogenase n=1 Tax=Nocardia neocaledoniensis TaxID=236511 RepID=A0A317N814_9NOCA|nr:aldehyde dehydrogenase family protein [Nocardia neocaledoniensis]PWV71033.1 aldehyde dehydrogenase (NAD+) [Nocardia neocaledoniensis]GEM30301.1 aldehyde dehydrogenase [Nocardia neocaledoniensis NBRC 108232]
MPITTAPIPETVAVARARFDTGWTRPLRARAHHLRALRRLLVDNDEALTAALHDDLHKNPTEAHLTEIDVVVADIDHTLRHLRRWARPRRLPVPLAFAPARARILPEPLGVVLIISAWNYPVQLLLAPLVGVLAAGNTAVLKPSDLAPATSALIARLVPRYFPEHTVSVVEGNSRQTTELLTQHFDHIVFTGGGTVGRVVMRAAAEHLTPVTLELGGKSPAWVDDIAHLPTVARRLVWAKFTNAGQSCVAPDYVLTTPDRIPVIIDALRTAIAEIFGPDPRHSNDYGRIVNDRHFDRLTGYLDGTEIAIGGDHDRADRYLAPTVVTFAPDIPTEIGPQARHPLLAEEIFGPILPIIAVASPEEAIRVINGWDKPLALYVFSDVPRVRRLFEQRTSSGSIVHNAALLQVAGHTLPFGGIGASGMGAYHGHYSWQTFTHDKPVLAKPRTPDTLRWITPPYHPRRVWLTRRLTRRR